MYIVEAKSTNVYLDVGQGKDHTTYNPTKWRV